MNILDIMIVVANMGFIVADMRQAMKLYKNKNYDTRVFSKTHFKIKTLSLSILIIAYTCLNLPFSYTTLTLQLLINFYMIKRIGVFKKCHTKNH